MFIPEALSTYFDRNIKMLCAEFPLLKDRGKNYLSTNIDWMLYNVEDEQLEFCRTKDSPCLGQSRPNSTLKLSVRSATMDPHLS